MVFGINQSAVFTCTLITMVAFLECGSGIVLGNNSPSKYPFLVNIQYLYYQDGVQSKYRSFCGGTILDSRTILTAAHCFEDIPSHCKRHPNHTCYRIVAGSGDLALENNAHEQIRHFSTDAVITHEDYDDVHYDNDIALIHLPEKLRQTEFVQAIPLVYPGTNYRNDNASIAGWGRLSIDEETEATVLVEAQVDIYSANKCEIQWGHDFHPDSMLCAQGKAQNDGLAADACQGDSGGPLVAKDKENPDVNYVVGIISWGYGCGYPEYPGVYTRLETYLCWILRKVNGRKFKEHCRHEMDYEQK